MDHPFRNAAFGGFNRQDVLDYLEKIAQDDAQKQQELQQKLDEVEEDRKRLSDRLLEQEDHLAALEQEKADLVQQLERAKAELDSAREQEAAQKQEVDTLRRETEELHRRTAELEPGAAAYASIKDRTAGVELEAHCRAQKVLDQADAQARELRRGMEQWMSRVAREYDALRTEVEATVSHAADKLEKANKCLEQVNVLLADQDVALEELSQAYAATDLEKKPAPMPLSED